MVVPVVLRCFQIAVSLDDVGERVALVDHDFHFPALHHLEHVLAGLA